jgi:hypothetical protein
MFSSLLITKLDPTDENDQKIIYYWGGNKWIPMPRPGGGPPEVSSLPKLPGGLVEVQPPYTIFNMFNMSFFNFLEGLPEQAEICFAEGTPIVTDQGIMKIENITSKNSINKKPVVGITKQKTNNDLVLIKKHALDEYVPSEDTYVTKDHGIFLNNTMYMAEKLVDGDSIVFKNIGECNIYNVVFKTHEKLVVNNMITESLDPDTLIAKYLLSENSEESTERKFQYMNR